MDVSGYRPRRVTQAELTDMLRLLSGDARTAPVGAKLEELDERWEHVRLFPPAYDRIELSADGDQHLGEQATRRATT